MLKTAAIAVLLVSVAFSPTRANATTCVTFPYTFTNGTTADATQVMSNLSYISGCVAPLASPSFTGNATIGVASSTAKLGVSATTTYSNDSTYAIRAMDGSNANKGLLLGYDDTQNAGVIGSINSGTAWTNTLINPTSGNVGIGTITPTYLLYVNGTAYASGAAGALSDIRHKDKVKTLPSGELEVIKNLRPVSFIWKEPKDDGMKGEQFGFIAQEVEKILPSVILTENNKEKTKGIKYTELIPVLTKAIQEQQDEIDTLKKEIDDLKKSK